MNEYVKKQADLPVVEPNESTHLLAEQDGVYTRVPTDKVGVTSWNDLQDRPFGEEKTVIEWDGVIGDRVFAENANSGVKLVKVSDATIPAESLAGARVAFQSSSPEMPGEEMTLTEGAWQVVGGVTVAANGLLFVVETPEQNKYPILGVSVNITFAEPGLYFVFANMGGAEMWCSLFECSTVKQLDPKFIPSSGGGGSTMVINFTSSDGSTGTIDRTFDEIAAEINAGRFPVVRYQEDGRFPDYFHLICFFDDGWERAAHFANVRFGASVVLATISVAALDDEIISVRSTATLTATT